MLPMDLHPIPRLATALRALINAIEYVGKFASLPPESRVGTAIREAEEALKCDTCEGSGVHLERHDYATETLACLDCLGTGKIA